MFVAWRDLRFAKGRFTLMGTVVVLITLLVGLLSGLTAGLARENTSAVTGLNADHIAFASPPDGQSVSFTASTVRETAWRSWEKQPGITAAQPLGIRTLNAAAVAGSGRRPCRRSVSSRGALWHPGAPRSDRARSCSPNRLPRTWRPAPVTG